METMWISLKGNVNCGSSNQSKKVFLPAKTRTCNKELIRRFRRSFSEVINRGFHSPRLFSELNVGDPARNIIEMIFQRALTNPSNQPTRKIKRVLRVKNSTEVLERFEKYRDMVKELAHDHHQKTHPRSTVDGNELLRFYGTTMCCGSERSRQVSELCRDPACRVCRILQSNFDTDYTKKNGIRLSTNSDELIDIPVSSFKAKIERAVIICRLIAGTVTHSIDEVKEGCDAVTSKNHHTTEHMVVRNPSAVLPCFVIVFT
ncbi:zinc finger (C2H2 type) family protein [Euphorbia peplus]|nr:zinc finger (C2H2 type) family protein [Euphorbia peplus]